VGTGGLGWGVFDSPTIDDDYDTPSGIADQLGWIAEAGLEPLLAWAHRDLAVIIGTRPSRRLGGGLMIGL
jgi:hypothetical protein